jgi:hypothetical protein
LIFRQILGSTDSGDDERFAADKQIGAMLWRGIDSSFIDEKFSSYPGLLAADPDGSAATRSGRADHHADEFDG